MRLIKDIEIGYFRSIYKTSFKNLAEMNVFFGRNDSGKSNVLRALNLFFNGQTNPHTVFDFGSDLCHARLAETKDKTDARRFVYVKVTFDVPNNWQRSLGNTFYVKKSWSFTKQKEPNFETSIRDSKKKIFITRFLNKINFLYIPAIKDRQIFSYLLGDVYRVISKHKEFNDSLENFTVELKKKTKFLTDDLQNVLSMQSNIAPPSDLTALFRALDFDTTNSNGDKYSLTLQHGDGIQVLHIPSILAFISDFGEYDFNIWGFEEPENSLELAYAVKEAERLCNYSKASNKQLFITSHSPAFFSLNNVSVDRYFIFKDLDVNTNRKISVAKEIKEGDYPSELMGETPLLPVISSYLTEYSKKIDEEIEKRQELEQELARKESPVLFVEGVSDKLIVDAVSNVMFSGDVPYEVISCEGTSKMDALAADGKTLTNLAPGKKVFVLVDNDKEGRELYKNKRLNDGGKWVLHNSNNTYWCRLPFLEEFQNEYAKRKIDRSFWPCVIENCFSKEFRMNAIACRKYALEDICFDELRNDGASFKKITDIFSKNNDEKMYFFAPHPDYKVTFAKYVVEESQTNPEILNWLVPILAELNTLINT